MLGRPSLPVWSINTNGSEEKLPPLVMFRSSRNA